MYHNKTFKMHNVICSSHLCDSGSEDDDDCSPETKAERERVRRQANNARERYAYLYIVTVNKRACVFVSQCTLSALALICISGSP